MVRVRRRWNQQDRPRSVAQIANAVSASVWKLAADVLLNLENENFETHTQQQRLDLVEELVCYLIHFSDRWIYTRADESVRGEFVSHLATDLGRLIEDSRVDVQGEGEYRPAFFDRLNRRASDYAGFSYSDDEGCSFAMRCRLGEWVRQAMGERDNRWIPDYIVGKEAPTIEASLRRTLLALAKFE